jgi:hypothetical protein
LGIISIPSKIIGGIVALIYLSFAHVSIAKDAPVSVRLIPEAILFNPPMADPTAPIPALKYFHTSSHEDYFARVTAGATVGLIKFTIGSAAVQINGQGGIMGRLHLTGTVMAETTDFRIGVPIDIAWPYPDHGLIFEINPYHSSSHLNDDTIFKNADTSDGSFSSEDLNLPVNYTRDTIQLFTGYRFNGTNRVFASFSMVSEGYGIGKLFNYGAGSELFGVGWDLQGYRIQPYLAETIQTKKETDWTVDLNVQAGFSLSRSGGKHRLRFALEYMTGSGAEGQRYQKKERNLGIGLSFDL